MTVTESIPVGQEFFLMNLSPCFYEATLPRWQLTSGKLDRVNSKDR